MGPPRIDVAFVELNDRGRYGMISSKYCLVKGGHVTMVPQYIRKVFRPGFCYNVKVIFYL